MFIRKNNVIYNLNKYAKVFRNEDNFALCLADVQGDYDSIYFDSEREMNEAFDAITRHFFPPVGLTAKDLPQMINFDDLDKITAQVDEDELSRIMKDSPSAELGSPELGEELSQYISEHLDSMPIDHEHDFLIPPGVHAELTPEQLVLDRPILTPLDRDIDISARTISSHNEELQLEINRLRNEVNDLREYIINEHPVEETVRPDREPISSDRLAEVARAYPFSGISATAGRVRPELGQTMGPPIGQSMEEFIRENPDFYERRSRREHLRITPEDNVREEELEYDSTVEDNNEEQPIHGFNTTFNIGPNTEEEDIPEVEVEVGDATYSW